MADSRARVGRKAVRPGKERAPRRRAGNDHTGHVAQQLLEDGKRLVDGLDVEDATAGPARMLSRPSLRATQEYLYAEANQHLWLRPAGRSRFGRLPPR